MKTDQRRMTLDDFKLEKLTSQNEIEKVLGDAAGTCHRTCNNQDGIIDWVDWEAAVSN